MNKSRIPVVLMTAALTASSFGTLPVCASSVTDLEQQAEDIVNESVIKRPRLIRWIQKKRKRIPGPTRQMLLLSQQKAMKPSLSKP